MMDGRIGRMDVKELVDKLAMVRDEKQVVLVTGVFDLLHEEHVQFLERAMEMGDLLLIGLERDERVRRMKGHDRPVWNDKMRLKKLLKLGLTDWVFLLPEEFDCNEDYEKFMELVRPDVYAVSSHSEWLENKQRIVEMVGGRLKIVHDWNPEVSTTKLIERDWFECETGTGRGVGRLLGYPTLNLKIPEDFNYRHGIYAGWVRWKKSGIRSQNSEKIQYMGGFHFGPIPTFERDEVSLEVFVLDVDIKEKPDKVEIKLVSRLREVRKFVSKEELTEQIGEDVEEIREVLG